MSSSNWPVCFLVVLVLARTQQSTGYSNTGSDTKPFRPSTQFNGDLLSPSPSQTFYSQSQTQYQSLITPISFAGSSHPISIQQQTPQFSLPQTFNQFYLPTNFVAQNVIQNQNTPTQQHQTIHVVQNPVPQKQTNFVEQNIKPNYRQQQNYPLTPTHTSSQTFVGQSHLSQPTQLVEQHRQQSGVQNFAVSSTQINFVNQNDISENVLRESRHHYVFKNATFDEDGDEIDTPSDRIYRGWELDPHEFPWMVKLMATFLYGNRRGYVKRRYCGGALISDRWVLTARHCVTWHPPEQQGRRRNIQTGISAIGMKVFLGSHGFYGEDGEQIKADRAVGREDYGRPQCPTPGNWCLKRILRKTFFPWTLFGANLRRDSVAPLPKQDDIFTNDIALVRLNKPVRMNRKIHPVNLPKVYFDYLGYRAYVSGWGIESPQHEGPSRSLKAAEMIVVDGTKYEGCSSQSGWGKMCAKSFTGSTREGSACPGDSGSPLVTWDKNNGGWTLIGLLSNGAKSCFEGNPEIYTRVVDYLPWIYDTMRRTEQEVP